MTQISHRGEEVVYVDNVTLDGWGALAIQAQQLGSEGRLEIPVRNKLSI